VDFFVYSRDAPGTEALRDDEQLLEEHWSYMDAFADTMIARGPTLAPDRETATGSLHVLGLPSVAAANEFVEREPNNRAGVYREHRIWAFDNLLGRTMWEFPGEADEPRFLVIAFRPLTIDPAASELILYGTLTEPDGADVVGVAAALQAPDRNAVVPLLASGTTLLDAPPGIEVHDWEFGGRR
jgi:hypothetical protein